METSGLILTVLAVLILWVNQGDAKALNEWNDNYPNDFFDPYDQPRVEHKKKKKHGGTDSYYGNGPFDNSGYYDNNVPQYQPKGKGGKGDYNDVNGGYYPQWDEKVAQQEAEWDVKIQNKWDMPRPGQKLNDDWEWESSEESYEASGSNGFSSDDEDLVFEVEQFEQDERRKERLQYELEDADWERERLVKRLSRVADRVEEEKQIINSHGKKARKYY